MQVPLLDLRGEYLELKDDIDAAVARVLARGAFIGGEEVRSFEAELASFLGARHVVGVGNGTDALEIALQSLGIGPGDLVLTVPFTFAATIEAIVRAGATPLFADVGEADFNLDVAAASRLFERHPIKAVLVVHLYGHPADLGTLLPLARRHGAVLVEDAAQAHGASCVVGGEKRRVGSIGDAACFSFYPTKNLGAVGDAGAIATNRDDVAERARLIANHGEAAKYRHVIPNGRNSRLDAVQAAVLRLKLRRLDGWNEARRAIAKRYEAELSGLPVRLPRERPGAHAVYQQYVLRLPDRDRMRAALTARGVETSVHYPLAAHRQDGFRSLGNAADSFPVAERCAGEVLSLPMFPRLSDEAVEHVTNSVRAVIGESKG